MIGRMIANVIYLSCITVFIILGSILFLKANWQGNSLVIGITILLMSLIVNGIGMLLGTATKSTGLSIGLLVGFMMIWSKASGSFNPEPSKSVFAVLSPNFNAKNIFYATIYGGSTDMILKSIGFMGLIALLIYLLFFILEGRRKHERI